MAVAAMYQASSFLPSGIDWSVSSIESESNKVIRETGYLRTLSVSQGWWLKMGSHLV